MYQQSTSRRNDQKLGLCAFDDFSTATNDVRLKKIQRPRIDALFVLKYHENSYNYSAYLFVHEYNHRQHEITSWQHDFTLINMIVKKHHIKNKHHITNRNQEKWVGCFSSITALQIFAVCMIMNISQREKNCSSFVGETHFEIFCIFACFRRKRGFHVFQKTKCYNTYF